MKHLALLIALLAAGPLAACCMVPRGYPGDVDQAAQQVVILHRAKTDAAPGYQEMLIRVQPFFQDAQGNPEYIAWVITLPGKPLRYDVADKAALQAGADLHEKLFQLARRQWADRSQFEWPSWLPSGMTERGMEDAKSLVIEEAAVQVGPYTITPVRAQGTAALDELNAYLQERGFPQEDRDHLAYFVENDFTFLCVRITPPQGQATLGGRLDLPPLVLGFETDAPYYPARFSSRQGNFALDLTLISDKPLDTASFGAARERLKAVSRGYVQLVNLYSMQPLPDELAGALSERATTIEKARWYVNRIQSEGFNPGDEAGVPAIAGWKDDVFIKVGDRQDELPGFWYYGDQDIPFLERMFREHAMAVFFLGGFAFFFSLFIKTRLNRRKLQAKANANQ
ncbi:MAG: DUF2330 domain-containing protein [Planctomycetota bacterium]|nr:DUF2330 domain-containing protein [Planctomycetota bacterium]